MVVLKSCGRCRGDLASGIDGELTCIQCGYELNPAEHAPGVAPAHGSAPAARRCGVGGGDTMFTCIICRFDAELDDAVVPAAGGRCVCLRCFTRETVTPRPMPKGLRREVIAAPAEIPAAGV